MEATGGYEQRAFAQLSEHGLPVAVVNPRAVRQFAQSMGWLEKTDAIDAGMIAWYAQTKKSQPLCLAPQTQLQLRARVTRLRQLTEVRTAQLNQQRLVTNPAVQNSFRADAHVPRRADRRTPAGHRCADRCRPVVARTQSGLPHHQGRRRSHRGPHHGRDAGDRHALQQDHLQTRRTGASGQRLRQTSGQTRGARRPRRQSATSCSSWAAWSLVTNRTSLAFQQRLRAAGKPPKVVRIAVAHKLLVRLNAKAREVRQTKRALATELGNSSAAVVEVVGKRETAPPFSAFPSTHP